MGQTTEVAQSIDAAAVSELADRHRGPLPSRPATPTTTRHGRFGTP